ncbi:MAG: dethiobiotin synthase [Bryobacterales bacterium]|nr:dethiobiotin synthase [Bryobacterales bacterium]
MRGIFVTGTDTGVGKTVTSAVVLAAIRKFGPAGYWKPVQTGIENDDDTAEVERLADGSAEEIAQDGIRLPRPLSPHLAARLAGRSLRIEQLMEMAGRLDSRRFWVVEGAGGLLVPLNDTEMMADLIRSLGLPGLITARSGLGTINHTLLTVSEMRRRGIPIAGVVLVGEPNTENRRAIERYGGVDVLAELPVLKRLVAGAIEAEGLRAAGQLRQLVHGSQAQASTA